jgi:hypothetical protein
MLSSGSTLEVEVVFISSECILMCLEKNNSCNLFGLQQDNGWSCQDSQSTVKVIAAPKQQCMQRHHSLCRLCTAECVPAMHDESNHVFVVETTWHIVPAPAGTGSLLDSIFSMNIPAHAVKT